MSKVFRSMRFGAIESSGGKKYILYALGEILLIVVGILIALQISNWNEEKRLQKQSQGLLEEIHRGFSGDSTELASFIRMQELVLKSQNIVVNWMQSEAAYDDSLSVHLSRIYIATDFPIDYSGYETLKSFGLNQIDNADIRMSISNVYESKYPKFIKFTEIYQGFLDQLLMHNSKHFSELNYMQASLELTDVSEFKTDKDYAYHLRTLKNFNQLMLFQAKRLQMHMTIIQSKFE